MSASFEDAIKAHIQPCHVCGQKKMSCAWRGFSPPPYNQPIAAYICGDCGAQFYLGNPNDPVFQMIAQINQAYQKPFEERAQRRKGVKA